MIGTLAVLRSAVAVGLGMGLMLALVLLVAMTIGATGATAHGNSPEASVATSADPSASPSPVPSADLGGDTRTVGEGPGLVGAPFLAIGGVVLLGLVSAGLTIAYVRLTNRHTDERS